MTEAERRGKLGSILESLVSELDVPPSKYKEAKDHYDAVGAWLNEEDSDLTPYEPRIYPQGSFALGTAVRRVGVEEYDVDSVCCLQIEKNQTTQQHLKDMVGNRLKAHKTYARMLDLKDGGRRCWTLKYADESKFHLDILPAIPDEHGWLVALGVPIILARHAICITDKDTWNGFSDWPKSNPQGYTEWFKSRMHVILEENRRVVAVEKRMDVQHVPDYEVRTPLQRVIQLLKRHRDVRYNGDDDKPISIIITTLAARAYNNEADLVDAMLNVVPGMHRAIENRNGVQWVANPVNPKENFADKWAEEPRKAKVFLEWLQAVEREHKELLTGTSFQKVGHYLAESYGQRDVSAAMKKYAGQGTNRATAGRIVLSEKRMPSRFNVPHRETLRWPMALRSNYEVAIAAEASRKGFRTLHPTNGSPHLPKDYSILFEANTNVPRPFDVHWQVVNTGDEAERASQLRGGFYDGDRNGGLTRKESTRYRGMHWVECFIVKDGRCVARSGEFVVSIE